MTLSRVKAAQTRLSRASQQVEQARLELRGAIEAARESHTLEQIGQVLGVSRQRVNQILRKEEQ